MNNDTKRFKYSRSVIFLPGILLFLFLTANSTSTDFVQSTRKYFFSYLRALGFALAASMVIGCLFLPTGFITKPTPYLWKAFGGISFFYLSVLIYFLYLVLIEIIQNKESAVHIIKTYFDPNLGSHNYQEVSYAQDCRIYAPEK